MVAAAEEAECTALRRCKGSLEELRADGGQAFGSEVCKICFATPFPLIMPYEWSLDEPPIPCPLFCSVG